MTVELLIQVIINGLFLGMLYLLIVLGMDIILRATKILNFAHGQIYMLGAFVFYFAYAVFHLNFLLSLLASGLVLGLLGFVIYLGIFNTMQNRMVGGTPFSYRLLMSAMASVGLMMILQQSALLGFGSRERGIQSIFPHILRFGEIRLSVDRLIIILLSLLICFSLYLLMFKTKVGKAMRAVSFDAEVASLQGISSVKIYCISFSAGFAGSIVAPVFSITAEMGHGVIFMAFLVMVVGGIGSYKGAVIGAFTVGLILSFGFQFFGGVAQVILFIMAMILLIFRPGGIVGKTFD
jgi:branched-chain amino acid transport system permease protein